VVYKEKKIYRHLYGPVLSRRLGYSLGIDIVPYKICSLDCIYCQLGRTTKLTLERESFYPLEEIVTEIRQILTEDVPIDYLTFSGSGEPTLYHELGRLMRKIKAITPLPLAVLTNSTLLYREDIRHDLLMADLVVPSLDAVTQEMFKAVNRPHPSLDIETIIEGLIKFCQEYKGQLWLEVLLVKGINDSLDHLQILRDTIRRLQPDKVQLNTVIRPPTETFAHPLGNEELEKIRNYLGSKAEVVVDFPRRDRKTAFSSEKLTKEILEIVSRRPVTIEDIHQALGYHRLEISKALKELKQANKIREINHQGRIYFELK